MANRRKDDSFFVMVSSGIKPSGEKGFAVFFK